MFRILFAAVLALVTATDLPAVAGQIEQDKRDGKFYLFRVWKDASGTFSVEAAYVETAGGSIVLRNREGKQISVPATRLSQKDREYAGAVDDSRRASELLSDVSTSDLPPDYFQTAAKAKSGNVTAIREMQAIEPILKRRRNILERIERLTSAARDADIATSYTVTALALVKLSSPMNDAELSEIGARLEQLLSRAIDLGDPQAALLLATLKSSPSFVKNDLSKAVELATRAAQHPLTKAKAELLLAELREAVETEAAKEKLKAEAPVWLLGWTWKIKSGYAQVSGELQNKTEKPMKNLAIVATFYDDAGNLVDTSSPTLIDLKQLLPGQTSSFKVLCRQNPKMESCKIQLQYLLGGRVPYYAVPDSE